MTDDEIRIAVPQNERTMEAMNSDTPETDKQAHWTTFEDGFHGVERCKPEQGSWVPIDFARTLELRNKRLVEALKWLEEFTHMNNGGAKRHCPWCYRGSNIDDGVPWHQIDHTKDCIIGAALADQKEEKA